jgi:osmotically-inducible protein OsmY
MSTARLRHAVLISVLVAGACSRTDPSLQIAVDQALSARSETNALSVDISVSRRIVRLSGEVASRDQEQLAVAAARSVPGVREVVDALRLSDATIVAAVKQALAADPLVGRIPIEVDASNGNVRLISDQTGPDDRKQAVAIASKIDGVRQVEDRMR